MFTVATMVTVWYSKPQTERGWHIFWYQSSQVQWSINCKLVGLGTNCEVLWLLLWQCDAFSFWVVPLCFHSWPWFVPCVLDVCGCIVATFLVVSSLYDLSIDLFVPWERCVGLDWLVVEVWSQKTRVCRLHGVQPAQTLIQRVSTRAFSNLLFPFFSLTHGSQPVCFSFWYFGLQPTGSNPCILGSYGF